MKDPGAFWRDVQVLSEISLPVPCWIKREKSRRNPVSFTQAVFPREFLCLFFANSSGKRPRRIPVSFTQAVFPREFLCLFFANSSGKRSRRIPVSFTQAIFPREFLCLFFAKSPQEMPVPFRNSPRMTTASAAPYNADSWHWLSECDFGGGLIWLPRPSSSRSPGRW